MEHSLTHHVEEITYFIPHVIMFACVLSHSTLVILKEDPVRIDISKTISKNRGFIESFMKYFEYLNIRFTELPAKI